MENPEPKHPDDPRIERRWATLAERLSERASAALGPRDADAFITRAHLRFPDLWRCIERLYAERVDDVGALVAAVLDDALDAASRRSESLRRLDHRREIHPSWFLDESMLGYVAYADRFAGDLDGVRRHLDYLEELGVTYLHLMPLLRPRPAPNDGGYAVEDYRQVDERVGDVADLERLATELRDRGMSLCIDLVVNHTADTHEWARRALAGDRFYRDYYLTFPDRELPDRYEETLPEVFPESSPGSFSWVEGLDRWVWTTFNRYQWDLDYTNPAVFREMVAVMCVLANLGIDVLRLDAVPFTWKRMGTMCQNEPEAHVLLQAFRAVMGIVAPGVIFKAEAIVPPGELVPYLGAPAPGLRDVRVDECQLAYHNQLMVMVWNAVATRDVRLPTIALGRMRQPPTNTGWVTYVRGHDDIGWAVTDEDAGDAGLNAWMHRRFLNDFYSGRHPGSFATGVTFQENVATGDARISGTTASLAGIEQALETGDERLLDAAVRRHLLLHAIVYGWGGIPLLYMGDELGLRNDWSFRVSEDLADDNRWVHRPRMDWVAAERRRVDGSLEQRLFAGMRALASARRRTPPVGALGSVTPWWTGDDHVLGWFRDHERAGRLLGLANVDDNVRSINADLLHHAGLARPVDALGLSAVRIWEGRVHLPPLSVAWFVDADGPAR